MYFRGGPARRPGKNIGPDIDDPDPVIRFHLWYAELFFPQSCHIQHKAVCGVSNCTVKPKPAHISTAGLNQAMPLLAVITSSDHQKSETTPPKAGQIVKGKGKR